MGTRSLTSWCTLTSAVLSLTGCGDTDGMGNHGCPLNFGNGWLLGEFSMEHTEPRHCPVFLSEPTPLQTGATFVDGGIRRDATHALGNIRNGDGVSVTGGMTHFRRDVDGVWNAPLYINYTAGTGVGLTPDLAQFELEQDGFLMATADLRITYSSQLVASINPVFIDGQQAYTVRVIQGVAPFTYRWFRDWEEISTDETVFPEPGKMQLRLDVVDARGHATSVLENVWAPDPECPGTEIRC